MIDECMKFSAIVVVIMAVLLAIVFMGISISNRIMFPSILVEIEQLRADAGKVDIQGSENVLGQVARANRMIKSNQEYNKRWWADFAIPDGWDDIEIIDISRP